MIEKAHQRLPYHFRRPALLEEALTHRSHAQEKSSPADKQNERLEFLGDAVLGLIVSEYLADTFPALAEGDLSQIRARLVGRVTLADAARRLSLGRMLRLGRGEERTKGRDKASLLANALEAVVGAIYMDGGMAAARTFTLQVLEPQLKELHQDDLAAFRQDYKSQLQEWCQQHLHVLPEYHVIEEAGPDHQKTFEVTVAIEQQCRGSGKGRSKKIAEQQAAKQALDQLSPATGVV
ncbi:MAG: ribonuclease III [Nitrospira sp.]|nr:ribonuclease III [Nitrospira sp.]